MHHAKKCPQQATDRVRALLYLASRVEALASGMDVIPLRAASCPACLE